MTSKDILSRVTELKELEQMQKEINAEMEGIKDEIKQEMQARETQEMTSGVFTIRYKPVMAKRFDTTAFKTSHKELYDRYTVEKESLRFTVN